MQKVEWKKINYIFSVSTDIKESIGELKLTEESILEIDELINKYNSQIRTKINGVYISLEDKKKIIEEFLKEVPSQLMILRNHLKNCIYAEDLKDFKFKYEKYVDEDIKRLTYIRH